MFAPKSLALSSALVLLMGGTAHAALTADQVWQSWKDAAASVGFAVTAATESSADGVVSLNGVSFGPAGAPLAMTISDMTLTTEDDGSVTIVPGASIGLDSGEDGGFSLVHEGLAIVAYEGEGGALVYDYAADTLSLNINTSYEGYSFDAEKPAQRVVNDFAINFETLEGSYSDTPGANRAFGMDLAAGKIAYTTLSDDPNMPMKTTSTSEAVDFTLGFEFVLPATIALATLGDDPANFAAALNDGMALAFSTTQGASTGSASQEDDFMPYNAVIAASGGEAEMSFSKDGFALTSSGEGFSADITTQLMPAPIKIASGPVVMNMMTPVMAGPASDYGLELRLSQFTLNDEIWGMFDPSGALVREPFDLAIDVSGVGSFDWIGMAVADATGGVPPIPAPETLDITELSLKVAGAAANATGAFTFDNAMGIPMPLGTADVSVTGANALIDGLIATGLLSQDDAMGARMMMGAFMTPGAEPDSLTSKIEAKEGFQIFVNGQQIQ